MYDGPIEIGDCFIWNSTTGAGWYDDGTELIVEQLLESTDEKVIFVKERLNRMARRTSFSDKYFRTYATKHPDL